MNNVSSPCLVPTESISLYLVRGDISVNPLCRSLSDLVFFDDSDESDDLSILNGRASYSSSE